MTSLHRDMLRVGCGDEGVLPNLSVLHNELEVVSVAQQFQLLQRITLDDQEIRVGAGFHDSQADALLSLFFSAKVGIGIFVRIHFPAPAQYVAGC